MTGTENHDNAIHGTITTCGAECAACGDLESRCLAYRCRACGEEHSVDLCKGCDAEVSAYAADVGLLAPHPIDPADFAACQAYARAQREAAQFMRGRRGRSAPRGPRTLKDANGVAIPIYFALPDPGDPAKMLYFFRSPSGRYKGKLRPWPPKVADYWPLYSKDLPEQPLPGERWTKELYERPANRVFSEAHWARVRQYRAAVEATIAADPEGCAMRFAGFHSRCCCCSKALTEEHSKVYGIGPECRHGMSSVRLAQYLERMRAAHGKAAAKHAAEEAT